MAKETDTARRLAEMSDAAAFERVAAAVLRAANPQLYANLSHPGVQPGGKTVKAPFDNVGWVQSAEGARFVCAAHTTALNDLQGKWLHDPATVKPRNDRGKPTKPAGDLVKGISEIQKLREAHPGLAATFALTTNRETSLDLRVSVEALAHTAGVVLDVWSVSRISHFLDTDPTGQIIRRNHLGIPVRLVSRALLLEMGKRSIRDHLPLAIAGESVGREGFLLGRGDTLVIGASGMGKTTACAAALNVRIDKGLPAIVIKTEFLVTAATMEAALDGELRRQEPELEAGAGGKALSLCAQEEPLLVLVEDVSRAHSPGLLLNKVLSWTRTSKRLWRAVCPIWPRYLDAIEDQKRVLADVTLIHVERYTSAEAVRAVCTRAAALGLQMDEHRAASIADRLGLDPLLIGLHDLTSDGAAAAVIQSFVEERLGIVADQAQRTGSEVLEALHELLRSMLHHRTLSPRWIEVKSWIQDQDVIGLVRSIAREGSVMRMSYAGVAEVLVFRHDRVMHSLFCGALAEVLEMDAVPPYVTDPFFAEMVAGAAVQIELPQEKLILLMDATPATAAYALRLASERGSHYTDIAAHALSHWLQREDVKGEGLVNQRYAVAHVLAETTDQRVQPLVSQFPPNDYPWHPLLAAAFRNGQVGAGLALLSMYEVGVTVAGKQSLLALVKRIYGSNLIAAVDKVLRRVDLSQPGQASVRVGALRLAGYLGDRSLAEAIRVCWSQDEGRDSKLPSYLFAAARCCGDDSETTLGPVCDAWEGMPEEPNSTIGQPAERLAADNVAWEFGAYIPHDAVRYFVERANASKKIEWPITYMLRTVDHPDAVEQVARYAAKSGFINAQSLKFHWERQSREAGRRMSSESKQRLMQIARDDAESDDVRKQAFAFWELTLDDADLDFTREIPAGSPLHDRALWARARRQDESVIPEMLRRMPEAPEHWLHIGRYLWSDGLTEALDPLLDRVAEEKGEGYSNLEYAVAKALKRVESARVVAMLGPRWAKLKTKPLMVQTVLLSTVPEAARLASEAFATAPNPAALLKHFVMDATTQWDGQTDLSVPAQLHNLKPYLDHLPGDEIDRLWEVCTKRGWLDFRTQWLEPRMQKVVNRRAHLPDDPVDTGDLDQALAGKIIFLDRWLERQVDRGATRGRVFAVMLDWLSQHDEERALAIVSDIVGRSATRREFQLFELAVRQRPNAELSVKAAHFDVFSRSLV